MNIDKKFAFMIPITTLKLVIINTFLFQVKISYGKQRSERNFVRIYTWGHM